MPIRKIGSWKRYSCPSHTLHDNRREKCEAFLFWPAKWYNKGSAQPKEAGAMFAVTTFDGQTPEDLEDDERVRDNPCIVLGRD